MEDRSFESLDTQRLTIGRFRDSDAEALAAYRDDAEVARYQGWTRPFSVSDARSFISSMDDRSPGRPGEWFQFAVRLRESDVLIGDVALRTTDAEPPEAELGFSFAAAYQGRGHAGEAVDRVVGFAFRDLALSRIFAITDTRNARARRLLERLDFALTHQLESGQCIYDRRRAST